MTPPLFALPHLPVEAAPLRLDANESPLGCALAVRGALLSAMVSAHRYPDREASPLVAALAAQAGLAPEQICLGAGSTLLIDRLVRALLRGGGSAVVPARSFVSAAQSIQSAGGRLLRAPMEGPAIDPQALLGALEDDTRLVYLATPNNPTGAPFSVADLQTLLDGLPKGVVLLLDEAYRDYALAEGAPVPDGAALVRQGLPVIALRTFSKAHGLAGLRVGYAMLDEGLRQRLIGKPAPYPLSGPALVGALAALDDGGAHVARVTAENLRCRAHLVEGLRQRGLEPAPSAANFVYLRRPTPSAPLCVGLAAAGVAVRDLTPWGDPFALRISVGTPADHARLFAALDTLLA
jgi:histidinol-phosphate aminotransferase